MNDRMTGTGNGSRLGQVRLVARREFDRAARYARERELEGMRSDLETQARRHPLAAIGVAFLAGYLVRRIF